MAKRAALIQRRQKTVRVSRSEQYLVNFKYLGDEPLPADYSENQDGLGKALNWYNYMATKEEARGYIKDYLEKNNRKADAKALSKVSDTWIPTTAAWVCRMLELGCKVPTASHEFLASELSRALGKATPEAEKPLSDAREAPKPTVQDRIREKTSEIIGDIEEQLDLSHYEGFSLYNWLKAREIPASYMGAVVAHYSPWLADLIEAYEGESQLKEAYSYLSRKELKERIVFFNQLIEDAEKYAGVAKKTRAPRKPRTVSATKKLKSFKFKKEDNDYKIASINPEKVLGAQELWAFNTKTKALTVFRAIDRGGLQVKGTSITGFDEKSSATKKTGRKPEIYIEKVMNGGKIVLRKLMDEIKTGAPLQERMNEHTILLKVIT